MPFVVFFLGTDVQYTVLDIGVFFAVGVVFPFVVAPAARACADVESPFAIVDSVAVEFVVPEVSFGGFRTSFAAA